MSQVAVSVFGHPSPNSPLDPLYNPEKIIQHSKAYYTKTTDKIVIFCPLYIVIERWKIFNMEHGK
jgi:hypothetical protein